MSGDDYSKHDECGMCESKDVDQEIHRSVCLTCDAQGRWVDKVALIMEWTYAR